MEDRINQREEGFKHCTERSENGSLWLIKKEGIVVDTEASSGGYK